MKPRELEPPPPPPAFFALGRALARLKVAQLAAAEQDRAALKPPESR